MLAAARQQPRGYRSFGRQELEIGIEIPVPISYPFWARYTVSSFSQSQAL
jgi:hypothetical protein